LIGLPCENEVHNLWYHKTNFDKLGLDYPKTWSELLHAAKILRANGLAPWIIGGKDGWQTHDVFQSIADQVAPDKIYRAEKGDIPWTDPDLVKAASLYKALWDEKVIMDGAMGINFYMEGVNLMGEGKGGIVSLGSYHMDLAFPETRLPSYVGEQRPFPWPDLVGNGRSSAYFAGADIAFAVNKNSKNIGAAWNLVKFYSTKEAFFGTTLPPIKGIEQPTTKLSPAELKIFKWYLGILPNAKRKELLYPELEEGLNNALQAIGANLQSPIEAMTELEQVSSKINR